MKNKILWKYYGLLIFLILLLYWPVSGFLFALKNDALAGYFPAKYFIAEALHNKIIPWWNPYINYGYPMHADFTSTFWSPFTWLFSLMGGYTVYTVHIEFLFYCALAAIGMFRLCNFFGQHKTTALIIALCYAGSGIFTGNTQHTNWVSAAALFPFLFQSFISIINKPNLRSSVLLSLWSSLFIVSAHPYFIILFLYTFTFSIYFFIKKSTARIKTILLWTIIAFGFILLQTSGYILSVTEIFPYLTRSNTLTNGEISNNFPPSAILSFILPFTTTVRNTFYNSSDISMLNAYTGIVGITFIISTLIAPKNYYQKLFLLTGGIFLLFSFGTSITAFINYHSPLLGFIRLISAFRLPAIFFLLLAASFTLNQYIKGNSGIKVKFVMWILLSIILICIFYSLINNKQFANIPFRLPKESIKYWIHQITFQKTILIQGVIQLIILSLLIWKINNNGIWLKLIVIFDLLLSISINAPFTIVGEKSVKEAQQILNEAPKDFPQPGLKPISENLPAPSEAEKIFGNWSMYSKEPGTINKVKTYPTLLKSNENYFDKGLNDLYIHSPFVYIARSIKFYSDSIDLKEADPYTCFIDNQYSFPGINTDNTADSMAEVKIVNIKPNQFSFRVKSQGERFLVLKQNYYKYWKAYIDGRPVAITPCNYTFMCIPIKEGNHNIEFVYNPSLIKKLGLINISTLLVMVTLLIFSFLRYRKN